MDDRNLATDKNAPPVAGAPAAYGDEHDATNAAAHEWAHLPRDVPIPMLELFKWHNVPVLHLALAHLRTPDS